jgi:phage FluMu protein Com
MNPINCWNCGKLFADLKNGDIQVCASTSIKNIEFETTALEIMCPRCKSYNSLIFDSTNLTSENYLSVEERKNKHKNLIKPVKVKKYKYDKYKGLTTKVIDIWMRTNRYDETKFK